MLRRARETGPALLVPLAWLFVAAAHVGVVAVHTLFVAHVVMTVLLAAFAVTGYAEMRAGTLRVWWRVIAVGTVVTAAGTIGFATTPPTPSLQALALYGWMVLPAVGFVDTARRIDGRRSRVYAVGAAGSLLGAACYVAGYGLGNEAVLVGALVVVGVAQTTGILDAVLRDL